MDIEERQKFSSQANPKLLGAMKEIAQIEGRQFQSVLEEAMEIYIEHKSGDSPRKEFITGLMASIEKNRVLGELLAK